MSYEIRRVALDWLHPRDGRYPNGKPRYIGLFDGPSYHEQVEYAREHGEPAPNPADYMPTWDESTPLGWCLYETVTEGTPVSPVFKTERAFEDWLVSERQMTRPGARELIKRGWVATGFSVGGRYMTGLEFMDRHAGRS
ncbi:hypothetical protein [Frankia sp. R82]|uniref:hypothetical protein n=1 Tax=Frankia sp. R82 TaxID=2950553 RepID=UPI002044586F|nr:hypothetical protein [Frankia sp. R82]MCM3884135.1 hypothetical protein [Frankia sp. R82]